MPRRTSLRAPIGRRLLKSEAATAQIEHVAFGRAPANRLGQRVEVLAPLFLDVQQPGLAQHAQVLRDVVWRDPETRRDLADFQPLLHQQPDDADACLVAERLERHDTVPRLHDGKRSSTGMKLIQGNRGLRSFGFDHVGDDKIAQTPVRSKRNRGTEELCVTPWSRATL
jgi:hypothetical protein